MVLHEEGFITCCSLCDTYFVLVSGVVSPSQFGGREGRKALEERNDKLQRHWATKRWTLLRCPTCIELIAAMPFLDWLEKHARDIGYLTPLSPCFLVEFEDGQPPPLFLDHHPQGEAGKPKWRLASGIGPAGLELDSSRSGRLWKPSLRAVGIDGARYEASDPARSRGASFHAGALERVQCAFDAAAEHQGGSAVDALAEELHASRPVFEHFKALEARLDSIIQEHAYNTQVQEAMERLAVQPTPLHDSTTEDPMMVIGGGCW